MKTCDSQNFKIIQEIKSIPNNLKMVQILRIVHMSVKGFEIKC